MTNSHDYTFFGQKVALTIQSASQTHPFAFFRLIKRNNIGKWEKPSNGEGQRIKFNLEEIVMILNVLRRDLNVWSTVNYSNNEDINTSIKWGGENKIIFSMGEYYMELPPSQVEILILLLTHILKEKIKYATSIGNDKSEVPQQPKIHLKQKMNQSKNLDISTKSETISNTKTTVTKKIKTNLKQVNCIIIFETSKALRLQFPSGEESWIPKSTIKSHFNSSNKGEQKFFIDSWILEKNQIATRAE